MPVKHVNLSHQFPRNDRKRNRCPVADRVFVDFIGKPDFQIAVALIVRHFKNRLNQVLIQGSSGKIKQFCQNKFRLQNQRLIVNPDTLIGMNLFECYQFAGLLLPAIHYPGN